MPSSALKRQQYEEVSIGSVDKEAERGISSS